MVPKKEGAIRICVDLKLLNENVLRELHLLQKMDETLAKLAVTQIFSKVDANSGFWQIHLAKKSLTSPLSSPPSKDIASTRYHFWISSAPEHFQKRMSAILSGFDGVLCLMDDVLVYGRDTE